MGIVDMTNFAIFILNAVLVCIFVPCESKSYFRLRQNLMKL